MTNLPAPEIKLSDLPTRTQRSQFIAAHGLSAFTALVADDAKQRGEQIKAKREERKAQVLGRLPKF